MPEIRPFRALRYDPATIADLALVVAPPYDVIDDREARAAPRAPSGQRRAGSTAHARSPATSPTIATAARPGPSPRGAPTGRSTRTRTRRSTSTSRRTACPGPTCSRTQRGFFARLRLRARSDEGSGVLPHERTMSGAQGGSLQAAPRDRRQHEPGRRPVRRSVRRGSCGARRDRRPVAPDIDLIDDDGVRHRLWAVAADGDGAAAVAPLLAAASRGPVDDRRRPPSLRDGAALSRRAPDVALVRGGSGVRLPPDAVPRRRRRAAHGPADAPDRARPRRRRCDGAARSARRAVRWSSAMSAGRPARAVRGRWRWPAAARVGSGCGRGPAGRS